MSKKKEMIQNQREKLLAKLEKEYRESETLQWFIEIELKRILMESSDYEDIKKLAQISKKGFNDKL
ncbi:hypothetical protein [Aquimarina rhabdastrellae]